MINQDYFSLSDFRSDGRKKEELRDINIRLGFDNLYDGSASFKIGLTEVECRVIGPIEVMHWFSFRRRSLMIRIYVKSTTTLLLSQP